MMELVVWIIGCYIATTLFWIRCTQNVTTDEMINPIVIYEENNINIFGCILLTILGNVVFLPVSICYWVYKLCTVGRSK